MRTFKNKYRSLFIPLLAAICFVCTFLAGKYPAATERIYSNGIYPVIARILSPVNSIFPFSIDDIFYLALILAIPILLLLLIFKKISFLGAGKILLNTLASLYILFYVLWGFNYFREDLNTRFGLKKHAVNEDQFKQVLVSLIDETNRLYCNLDSLSKEKTDSLVESSYSQQSVLLNFHYPAGIRKDKTITFSRFFAQSGISGYFGPFFNEIHVNREVTPLEYPTVLAHEKAHQLGITSEAEANFYAWLVCSQSQSQELRYAAGSFILRYFFNQAVSRSDYKELVAMIDPKVIRDFDRIREHWARFRNEKMDRVATEVNDAYLKSNNVEAGVQDYSGVVQFVLDFELDSTFQTKWNLNLNE